MNVFKTKLGLMAKLSGGWLAGIALLTHIIFWQSFWLPFSGKSVLMSLIFVGFGCGWLWYKHNWFKALKREISAFQWSNLRIWWPFLLFWAVLFAIIWKQMLVMEADGLYAGWVNIWGDWAAHLSYTTSFAFGDNFPPQLPIMAGHKFSYPFLVDFLSAILIKLKTSLLISMLLPSWVLSILLVIIVVEFGRKLTKSLKAGILTAYLFLLNGGVGFWWFLKDLKNLGPQQIITNLPREYTHLEQVNIQWINIITSQVVPQRGFLLGFSSAVLVYLLLWQFFNKKSVQSLRLAGWLTAMLPLIHAHSFALVNLIAAWLAGWQLLTARKQRSKILKQWLGFFLPVMLLGLPQAIYFYAAALGNNEFIRWQPGWMAYKDNSSVVIFWLKNLGLMALLVGGGFLTAKRRWKLFSLPFWMLFILANLYLWQPWEWDNTKILTHWYLMASVFGAWLIKSWLANKKVLVWGMATMVFGLSILAGGLDVWRLNQYQQRRLRFFSNENLMLAKWVKENIPAETVFLAADNHDHWLPTLTGRKIVLGFKGWLWTYGINYGQRENEVKIMFSGGEKARALFKKYKVDYLVIGPMERNQQINVNEEFFEKNFSPILKKYNNIIYRINY